MQVQSTKSSLSQADLDNFQIAIEKSLRAKLLFDQVVALRREARQALDLVSDGNQIDEVPEQDGPIPITA